MNRAGNQSVKIMTRGGQTFLHNMRMINQVLNKVLLWMLPLGLILGWSWFVLTTNVYQRYVGQQWLSAQIDLFVNNKQHPINFRLINGEWVSVNPMQVVQAPFVKNNVDILVKKAVQSFWIGFCIYFVGVIATLLWLKHNGASQTENVYVKGDRFLELPELKKLIRKRRQASNLSLGGLPLIEGTECAHLLFHGTTGTGKSTAIKQLLTQIRARNDRAIIYDRSCDFFREFYQPNYDVLLNPLDERGESWHLWNECRDSADYDGLASAQIPMPLSTQDPFWINAARTIFAAAAFEMRKDPERNLLKLLRFLLTADLERIQSYLAGTIAETLVSEKIEKTAVSIKSVLATYLKSLRYVKDGANPFCIRRWVQNENANHWLFITSQGDRHETLKPLITMWLDIAVNALLSLPANPERRIWLILDELTSLQQLPYLTQTLSEARKFGGCVVIGIQNYAQLCKVYGAEGAREMSSLVNTRFIFRQPDPEMAKWSAFNLGETITDEVREGISYGANTMRDGISIQRAETRKPLVSYSEIMNLNNLEALVRLPGEYPITKIKLQPHSTDGCNIPFIPRIFNEDDLKGVDELFDRFAKPGIPAALAEHTVAPVVADDQKTPAADATQPMRQTTQTCTVILDDLSAVPEME